MASGDLQHPVDPVRTSRADRYPPGSGRRLFFRTDGWKRRSLLLAGVAIVAAAAVWLYAEYTGSGANTPADGPRLLKPIELTAMPGILGHSIFWAGYRQGARTGYSEDSAGNVQISYLTGSSRDQTAPASLLNVTTYPYPGAYRATLDLARATDIQMVRVNGGIGFIDPASPYFVVLAWPSHPNLQVKVFDPVRHRALKMVRSGQIVPLR